MIESIFYKNSPLHDGAVIIRNNKIISARCVLPVSNNEDFPGHLGMRHRAAVGITEESDAVAIIVSEETGEITYVKDGELFTKRTPEQLEQFLNRIFTQKQ
jgi:DNA integrity scanning protein DisA with diadenylate cyclase activity